MKKISNIQILKRAAKKWGYEYGYIDKPYSHAIYVTNGERHFISRSKTKYGMYPTNPKFAEHLVDDKAVTKRVLKKFGFRVIRGKAFYIRKPFVASSLIKPEDSVKAAYAYAEKITYPVFVKPNTGSRGTNARIIFNETGLRKHIGVMRQDKVISFLIEKFTDRPEYRIFVVGGKVEFMYRKQRMKIKGTGEHTIRELIKQNNLAPDQQYLGSLLKNKKKTMQSVLTTKQELMMQETGNISLGAVITDYNETVPKKIDKWVNRLYRTLGLEVFGVDIFTKGEWDNPAKYLIIEVNSNPALSGIYVKGHVNKVNKIWQKIMKNYFHSY